MRDLNDFIGSWTISRVIDDLRAGTQAQLNGLCHFTGDATGDVIQHEMGQLMMPGMAQPIAAERRYIWRAGDAGIDVYFDDNRFFHGFDPNLKVPQAGHDCDPDRYDVRYDFSAWSSQAPEFRARWQVKGPRKDYVSETKFTFQSKT